LGKPSSIKRSIFYCGNKIPPITCPIVPLPGLTSATTTGTAAAFPGASTRTPVGEVVGVSSTVIVNVTPDNAVNV
jgi:hypothetical protein